MHCFAPPGGFIFLQILNSAPALLPAESQTGRWLNKAENLAALRRGANWGPLSRHSSN
jgi:hypothetical protein